MKPINIYALTRISNSHNIERYERQMSKRKHFLKIKQWEIDSLRSFSMYLSKVLDGSETLDFFYSFSMPKLGKEFDLLRVSDDYVVNVELKSGYVSDETIKRQLLQNKYYLSTLGRTMYFYTYISSTDRLVRLSNSGRLIDCEWEELADILNRQKECFSGNIEELFKEEEYLISPLTDSGRFLRQEYFLTLQQKDIRAHILKQIRNKDRSIKKEYSVFAFTGLPGTGKTILLYDIAMQLSKGQRVCVLHFGSHEKELEHLDERLKRVDFYYCDDSMKDIVDRDIDIDSDIDNAYILKLHNSYSSILVDEGHRIGESALAAICSYAKRIKAPVIFSYDREDAIAPEERKINGSKLIEDIDGCRLFKLTNRIRMNSELSTFISCVMCVKGKIYRHDYPSVSIAYANDEYEADILIGNFTDAEYNLISANDVSSFTCKEFDKVVMLIDDSFYYDEKGYLRYNDTADDNNEESMVRNLYHGLSRAKKNIAIVVKNNIDVFEELLYILQK